MKRGRWRGWWIVALVVIGFVAVLAVVVWPRERPLLSTAKRVGAVGTWRSSQGTDCPWAWLSNQEILVIRQSEASLYATPPAAQGPLEACTLNVESGRELPLDTLTDALQAQLTQNGKLYLTEPRPSSDGRWLLWDTWVFSSPTCFLVTSADGSHLVRWPKEPREDYANLLLWQRDGRAFLRLRYNANGVGLSQAEIRSPDRPTEKRIVPLPANHIGGTVLGLTTDGRVLICNSWTSNPRGTAYFAALDIATPNRAPHLYTLSPPSGTQFNFLALSPKGDRLAWMVEPSTWPAKRSTWQWRVWEWVGLSHRENFLELWVSRPDGSDRRQIGYIRTGPQSQNRLRHLQWSPDGRQIAFSYDHILYAVPID